MISGSTVNHFGTMWLLRVRLDLTVVALCEAFYIEYKRFDLDTLRVPNRSPTPSDDTPNSHRCRGFRGPGPA